MRLSISHAALIGLIALAANNSTANAQNAVVNGDFNADLTSWVANSAVSSFDAAQNIAGSPGSGSMLVINPIGNGNTVSMSQCINAAIAAGSYDFGGWILQPPGQSGSGAAGVAAVLHDAPGCSGNVVAFLNAPILVPSNQWALRTATIMAPAGVASVRIDLRIDMATPPPLQAWYDGIRFGPSPTTPVELQSFEVD